MGILKDIPIQVDKFVISCKFVVMDMHDNCYILSISERLFLATVEAVIDVHVDKISFQLGATMIDCYFPPCNSPSNLYSSFSSCKLFSLCYSCDYF